MLTHHQIVGLVAPLVRLGHTLDMPACDRLRRTLVFQSVRREMGHGPSSSEHEEVPAQAMLETLRLESPRSGLFCLIRTLCEVVGLRSTTQAEGASPAKLLAAIQSVSPQRQEAPKLDVKASTSRQSMGVSATVELRPHRLARVRPNDLPAVLGWDWSLLQAGRQGWQGSVRLRGASASRSEDAEHNWRIAATHLAQTLAELPQRFHERLRMARWRTLARDSLPALAGSSLALEVLFAKWLRAARESPLTLGLICIPEALLLTFLLRSERPRLTWPTGPRALPARAWESTR